MSCINIRSILAFSLLSIAFSQGFDMGGMLGGLSPSALKRGQEMSEKTNDDIKAANAATGMNITPLEDQTGLMRLFFTATPSPSPSPTPSITPSPSITPTPSTTPSPSVTPTTTPTPSSSAMPTVSKSPSPTPFRNGGSLKVESKEVEFDVTKDGTLVVEIDENGPVQEDEVVTIDSVEIRAQQDVAATPPPASPTPEALSGSGRFLMPGMDLPSVSRQACGLYLALTGYGESIPIPGIPTNTCTFIEVPIGPFNVRVTRINGRLGIAMDTYSFCMSPDCGGSLLLKMTKFYGDDQPEVTPTPAISQNVS